ncbi:MAG: 2-oxoglutarate and iron-dependent oxygenase domain-containing protein [Candidatus Sericytochromatia bacterium]
MNATKTKVEIPTLDYTDLISGNPELKKQFCKNIGKAYNEIGFVVIKNHGLLPQTKDYLYEQVKNFFSQPEEFKKKYEIEGIFGQRGYTSKGKEIAKGSKVADLKEFWQWGQEFEDGVIPEGFYQNVYVKELPEFNKIALEVYKKLEDIAIELLRAIALFLKLDEFYFDDKVQKGNSILRMLHYFPLIDVDLPEGAVRAEAHEDINLITLLIGASADGLQVKTLDGEWLSLNAKDDELVINVGDMLQRLTNGKLVSTTHRVINPPKELLGTSRYSIPFFLHPVADMDLTCLDSCIDEKHPKKFSDMTAGEYLNKRLVEIGLKK